MTSEEIIRILQEADSAARIQERAGNEDDADAIRRDAIRRILEQAVRSTGSRLEDPPQSTKVPES